MMTIGGIYTWSLIKLFDLFCCRTGSEGRSKQLMALLRTKGDVPSWFGNPPGCPPCPMVSIVRSGGSILYWHRGGTGGSRSFWCVLSEKIPIWWIVNISIGHPMVYSNEDYNIICCLCLLAWSWRSIERIPSPSLDLFFPLLVDESSWYRGLLGISKINISNKSGKDIIWWHILCGMAEDQYTMMC